jgi:DNA helicase-2/ATP-dependent DNA helicase PcrA
MEFNKAQNQAVEHLKGPMMVLAGPGSGKTRVITYRTKRLIEKGIKPENILVVTFTKAAADEMKHRFLRILNTDSTEVTFGTFHSVFFRIIRMAYGFKGSDIVKEEIKIDFIKKQIKKYEVDTEDENELTQSLISEISLLKNEQINIGNYYSISCPETVFRSIYNNYENWLRESNMIDFDDMLLFCYELFVERPDILQRWQTKYNYILVDEFQDINALQYKIIGLLAKPKNNLFIVGDDDQSIYRFRGAKPEILLNFDKDYPDAKRTILNINYRSSVEIVSAAGKLIGNNTIRFNKIIETINPSHNQIKIHKFNNISVENQYVIDGIMKCINVDKIKASEIAVIYRTNGQPRQLVEKLMEYNLPFTIRDRLPNIYEHWIAKDLIAYLRMSQGELKRTHLLRVMNKPLRYISRATLDEEDINFTWLKQKYSSQQWMYDRVEQLEYDVKIVGRLKPRAAIGYIRQTIGYENYLATYAQERKIKFSELQEILNEIQESSEQFVTTSEWFAYIEDYSQKLIEKAIEVNQAKTAITLTTMHSAKGLEFDYVFIIDANEGIIPHEKSNLPEDIEEERRLFYVAMTRARKNLEILFASERYNKKYTISRFVNEIM